MSSTTMLVASDAMSGTLLVGVARPGLQQDDSIAFRSR